MSCSLRRFDMFVVLRRSDVLNRERIRFNAWKRDATTDSEQGHSKNTTQTQEDAQVTGSDS